jgi:predicted nuclease with TOPRIM domain
MRIPRFRVPDDTRLPSHPVGEVVTYDDHAAEMDRVRRLMDKTSRDNTALRSQNTALEAKAERLTRERDEYRSLRDLAREDVYALRAEVERLRTALTRLLEANATRDHEGMSIDDWNAEILRAEEALEPAEEA